MFSISGKKPGYSQKDREVESRAVRKNGTGKGGRLGRRNETKRKTRHDSSPPLPPLYSTLLPPPLLYTTLRSATQLSIFTPSISPTNPPSLSTSLSSHSFPSPNHLTIPTAFPKTLLLLPSLPIPPVVFLLVAADVEVRLFEVDAPEEDGGGEGGGASGVGARVEEERIRESSA